MNEQTLRALLEAVKRGDQSVDGAFDRIRQLPYEDLGFAKIDHHRAVRCGYPEVVYAAGKTPEQVEQIVARCCAQGHNVLVTRADQAAYDRVAASFQQAAYQAVCRTITVRQTPAVDTQGLVAIVAAGTSDLPVAEEARITLEFMDRKTQCIYDVGVAGLHRLLAHSALIQSADVLIVVAGMDGALPSVVGGMVDVPVVAVPTSVGYGASFGGVAALLTMLNSCASGITVVNIDNGFGAGIAAATMIRRMYPVQADNG
ncbi:MAG: nickel pincer cofactor biosynthesis protein LarB [Planctomycetota bacterium]|jgi:NCAIR mutase (PurE)-related protein